MASEVLYTMVSPKEKVNFISEASDTGDAVTYAVVNIKGRSDRPDSTPKITHSDEMETCHQTDHSPVISSQISVKPLTSPYMDKA
ncbi:hypothetical protein DV515_00007643 [Chloebia gouldiae]|uniref:Uncharacterized protein n=1 Tax=Chloebia gouldiae TaxID=44316 RepID=A0A3L8SHP9_CHLGU|nr:hypothetical protein DV515_00007643 [Chloebia gouldiae]